MTKRMWRSENLQSTLSALLLVTSTVILVSAVVGFTVSVFDESIEQPTMPNLDGMDEFQARLRDQAESLLNQTLAEFGNQTIP